MNTRNDILRRVPVPSTVRNSTFLLGTTYALDHTNPRRDLHWTRNQRLPAGRVLILKHLQGARVVAENG